MVKHASLCLTAYRRPDQLQKCLKSLKETADYPHTIIVNVDGGDNSNIQRVAEWAAQGYITQASIVGGLQNRGIGRSFQNCLSLSEGEYLFKLDTDLIFKPGWLLKAVKVLENNPDVGAVGLFDYNRQDPNDDRFKPEFNTIERRDDCLIVKDFVSCAYAFRSIDLYKIYPPEDDGNHSKLGKLGLIDVVDNPNFGTKSVYVSFDENDIPFKTLTYPEPLVFSTGLNAE